MRLPDRGSWKPTVSTLRRIRVVFCLNRGATAFPLPPPPPTRGQGKLGGGSERKRSAGKFHRSAMESIRLV